MDLIKRFTNLRYKPNSDRFAGAIVPSLFSRFDWVVWYPDSALSSRFRKLKPKTVLCLANHRSIQLLLMLRGLLSDSIVVFAGEDTNLSEVNDYVLKISVAAKKVYYEAKDIESNQVASFCMGFINYYLLKANLKHIENLIHIVAADDWKNEGVLAAWGAIWPKLDSEIEDRVLAHEFVEDSDWLVREGLEPDDYWTRLAESRYSICPRGNGVQAPKLAESWLMHTIPIVTSTPCFVDLKKAGYPLLILDNWKQLDRDLLMRADDEFANVDWSKILHMLEASWFTKSILETC